MGVDILSTVSKRDSDTVEKRRADLNWRQNVLLYSAQAVVAAIFGGIVSILVRSMGATALLSFAIGAICGLSTLVWRITHMASHSDGSLEHAESHRESPTAQIVRISNIVNAVPVLDLEDFGPGYVVETMEDDQIFFSGQIVEEHDDDGDSLSSTIVLEVMSGEVIGIETHGKTVPVSFSRSVSINQLSVSPTDGFSILRSSGANQRKVM